MALKPAKKTSTTVQKVTTVTATPEPVEVPQSAPQPQQQIVTPAAGPGYQQAQFQTQTPPTLTAFFNMYPTQARLSSEGVDYIEELKKNVAKIPSDMLVKVVQVSSVDIDAVVIYDEIQKRGTCLLFSESFTSTLLETPTSRIGQVMANFKTIRENNNLKDKIPTKDEIKLISSIVITPEEYGNTNAIRMAHAVMKTLIGTKLGAEGTFTVKSLDGFEVFVCTNQQQVHQYISMHDPHHSPERCDIGFMVQLAKRDYNGNLIPGEPLFAVSGYTKFITPQDKAASGGVMDGKIMPVPTITTIASAHPISGYIPFALTIATDCFCVNGMWREPYKKFAKGQPNLGMIVDAVSRPVTTIQELTQLINQYFTTPILAIDITEGRYSIPGVLSMGNNHYTGAFMDIEQFFGYPDGKWEVIPNADPNLSKEENLEKFAQYKFDVRYNYYALNGLFKTPTGISDTRWVDFLALATEFDGDLSAISEFKMQPRNPLDRISAIKKHYLDTKVLYNTHTLGFGPGFARYLIAERFRKANIIINRDYEGLSHDYIYPVNILEAPIDWNAKDFALNEYRDQRFKANPYYGY